MEDYKNKNRKDLRKNHKKKVFKKETIERWEKIRLEKALLERIKKAKTRFIGKAKSITGKRLYCKACDSKSDSNLCEKEWCKKINKKIYEWYDLL